MNSADLLNNAGSAFFSQISTFFTNYLLPLVFLLIGILIGASMLIAWGKTAAKSDGHMLGDKVDGGDGDEWVPTSWYK